MKIALIAHDKKKPEMIEFAKKHKETLKKYELIATGETGRLVAAATGLEVKPFDTNTISDCICYTYYTLEDDGAKAKQKLELRLITTTYE